MAIDTKLTTSILDLSRNVDKLTTELKKNQPLRTKETAPKEKSESVSEVVDAIKESGLNDIPKKIEQFSDRIEKLDFSGLTKQIAQLDFKGLIEDLKNIKPSEIAQQSLKTLASETFKDLKSNIIGGLEKGGSVSKTGNYIVGEKGPEIVKLKTGDKVVPNSETMNQEIIKMLTESKKDSAGFGKKRPSGEEIGRKRMQLLIENPEYAENPEELEEEIKDFINRYGIETFTLEDVAKLGKPVKPSEVSPKNESTQAIANQIPQKINETAKPLKKTAQPLLAGPLKKERDLFSKKEVASETKSPEFLKSEGDRNISEKKESAFSKISSKLGKFLGGIVNPSGKKERETFSETRGINLENSLSPATKKSAPLNMADFSKPTLQKTIPQVSAPPKISKELGTLSKAPEISKTTDDSKLMFGGLIQKMEDVFAKNSSTKKQSSESNLGSETPIPPSSESGVAPTGSNQNAVLTKDDINEMKSALLRVASLLEGPISVTPLDYPFRPDSRRV
jgi:hypothetical protein